MAQIPLADQPQDDLHCSTWTRLAGFDPVGSAATATRLILVEIPLPWPSEIADVPWLADLALPEGCRVQGVVPETARPDGSVLVTCWQLEGSRWSGTDVHVASTAVADTVAALVDGPLAGTDAPREVLVCSHGSRDRCCGGPGTRLAVEARAALPGWRVRRTSHLGGHRFAPTALVLPAGTVWAHLDADVLVGLVERTIDPPAARRHLRGNVALDAPAQVAHAALFAAEGWSAIDGVSVTEIAPGSTSGPDGSGTWTVHLDWIGGDGTRRSSTHRVGIRTTYPVLVCGEPPERATKTAHEYELR